jgi:hypothetical protein
VNRCRQNETVESEGMFCLPLDQRMVGVIVEIHREIHHDPSIVQVDRLMVRPFVLCNLADGDNSE